MKALPVMRLFLFSALCVAVYGSHDHHNNHQDSYHSPSTSEIQNSEVSSDYTATPVLQYGDNYDRSYYYYRPNYGLLVGLPIAGLVVLVSSCVLICRYCCGNRQTRGMVLLQQPNVVHPPAPTQIIVQQPAYPPTQPPPYQMPPPVPQPQQWAQPPQQQQWAQPPQQQQWAQPPEQPQHYQKQAHDNPSFNPTAPPPYPH